MSCSVLVDTDTNILNTRLKIFSQIRGVLHHLMGESKWGYRGVCKGSSSPTLASSFGGRAPAQQPGLRVLPHLAGHQLPPPLPASFCARRQCQVSTSVLFSCLFWLELPSEQRGNTGKADPFHDLFRAMTVKPQIKKTVLCSGSPFGENA